MTARRALELNLVTVPSTATEPAGQAEREAIDEAIFTLAQRCEGWVILERRGSVFAHAPGPGPCPRPGVEAVLHKSTRPLHAALQDGDRTEVDGQVVLRTPVTDTVTVWILGAARDADLGGLRGVLPDENVPAHDTVVAAMLEEDSSRTVAPQALLLAVDVPNSAELSRRVAAVLRGSDARTHYDGDHLLLVIPLHASVGQVLRDTALASVARVGVASVPVGACGWRETRDLALAACRDAIRTGARLADAREPDVAARLILEAAGEAAWERAGFLGYPAWDRLVAYDARHRSAFGRTLLAWCLHGLDHRATASALHVHLNTLRYRLRRACEIAGTDLTSAEQLLALRVLAQVYDEPALHHEAAAV